jgi:hypothetical protein
MESTANLGLFAVHKIVSEYAERIYAYMEKTPRATKLCTVKRPKFGNGPLVRHPLSELLKNHISAGIEVRNLV